MRAKVLDEVGERTWALVFDVGDEVVSRLSQFASLHQLTAARFTAIGAFSEATLGYFDAKKKAYEKIPVREQVEVLSLIGDVALDGGQPKIHAHVVVGKQADQFAPARRGHGAPFEKGFMRGGDSFGRRRGSGNPPDDLAANRSADDEAASGVRGSGHA
jgi:predicted DNA-binding protein with PD1-like motif